MPKEDEVRKRIEDIVRYSREDKDNSPEETQKDVWRAQALRTQLQTWRTRPGGELIDQAGQIASAKLALGEQVYEVPEVITKQVEPEIYLPLRILGKILGAAAHILKMDS